MAHRRLRIVTPFEFSKSAELGHIRTVSLTERDEVALPKTVGRKVDADLVLFGKVTAERPHRDMVSAMVGGKTKHPKKLTLRLISVSDGSMVWKDELPFIIHVGSQLPSGEEAGKILAGRVAERLKEFGLMTQ